MTTRIVRVLPSAGMLRIALSALLATVAIALCSLWARSYWHRDQVAVGVPGLFSVVGSRQGRVEGVFRIGNDQGFAFRDFSKPLRPKSQSARPQRPRQQFHILTRDKDIIATVPHWFLVGASSLLATVLVARPRFGVRTMLIVTTLVAIFFGANAATVSR
jgi:hypothetical protein